MKRKSFNKNFFRTIKTIYKLGVIKIFVIFIKSLMASKIYQFDWKGRTIYIRKGSSDFGIFQQVHVFGHYNSNESKKLRVNSIVDLGSNNGMTVLHFKMAYPNAKIIAVEPAKNNYEMLLKNVSGFSNIYCLNNAIWNSNKELELLDNNKGEDAYMVNDATDSSQMVSKVNSITVDDIIEKYDLQEIDVLKIDIECSERELFASGYQSWLPKVRCIFIELHDWIQPGCAVSFFRAISNYQYSFSYVGENVVILFDKIEEKGDARALVNPAVNNVSTETTEIAS